jgi:hypothetical protein
MNEDFEAHRLACVASACYVVAARQITARSGRFISARLSQRIIRLEQRQEDSITSVPEAPVRPHSPPERGRARRRPQSRAQGS